MNNKNNGPKRQHIEPRRHLKYFADINEKIYAMRKKGDMSLDILSKKTSIEKICVEKNFYTLSPIGSIEDAFLVEKRLSKAEDRFFQTAESILEKKFQFCSKFPGQALFDYKTKEEIANFVYLQMLRGKTTRTFASKEAKQIYNKQTEELTKGIQQSQFKLPLCEIRKGLDRYEDELIKNSLSIILIEKRENSVILRLMMRGRCSLLVNATKIPFVTSDEPVVVTDYNLSKCGLYHKALFDSDVRVIYPLCPELLIVFHSFWEPLAKYGGVFLGQPIYEPSIVRRLNYLQLLNCHNFTASNNRDALERLRESIN